LTAHGADAVAFPALAFAPPTDPGALSRAVASVRDYDGVVLTSPRGVDAFFDALVTAGLDGRALAGRTIAVIGTGTAEAMIRRGLRPDVVPARARAEGLADELDSRGLLAAKWLHIRADEGRSVLSERVAAAGGQLDLVIGYRTIRPNVPFLLLRSLLPPDAGGEGFDAVVFASGKAARHFVAALHEAHGENATARMLAHSKVICIGPVTGAAVQALGIRVDEISEEASDEGLVSATARALGRLVS